MKTRVIDRYDLSAGVHVYYVEYWQGEWLYTTQRMTTGGGMKSTDYTIPAGWVTWLGGYVPKNGGQQIDGPAWRTIEKSRAVRVAKEMSEGKAPDPATVICEFSDGIEFKGVA